MIFATRSIYLTGWGDDFINYVIQIKNEVQSDLLTFMRRYDFKIGEKTKAILLVCQPNSSFLAKKIKLENELKDAFYKVVPELRENKVKIVSVARIENVGSKVAITSEIDGINPYGCFIGTDASRIKEISDQFENEFLSIVLWSDNIEEYISESLLPLKKENIISIEVYEENLIANVYVKNISAKNKAIGKNGLNLKLSRELTGYFINIYIYKNQVDIPEEELRLYLIENVDDLKNNQIQIVGLSRIKGYGSKIVVKWNSKNNLQTDIRPSTSCCGENLCNLYRLRSIFPDEIILFHDWYDEPEDLLKSCLYPIKYDEIQSIEIHEHKKIAVVTLYQSLFSRSFFDKRYDFNRNKILCEKITNYTIEFIYC